MRARRVVLPRGRSGAAGAELRILSPGPPACNSMHVACLQWSTPAKSPVAFAPTTRPVRIISTPATGQHRWHEENHRFHSPGPCIFGGLHITATCRPYPRIPGLDALGRTSSIRISAAELINRIGSLTGNSDPRNGRSQWRPINASGAVLLPCPALCTVPEYFCTGSWVVYQLPYCVPYCVRNILPLH